MWPLGEKVFSHATHTRPHCRNTIFDEYPSYPFEQSFSDKRYTSDTVARVQSFISNQAASLSKDLRTDAAQNGTLIRVRFFMNQLA